MYMRNACFKALVLALAVISLAATTNRAQAQLTTTLIPFTGTWKYNNSGTELGTAWRTNGYNDAAWSSGPGLLGTEPDTPVVYTVHAPISTAVPVSGSVTTFYFRATFNFAGNTNVPGFTLISSNLIDDGCAIYLNGRLAGSIRMPASYTAATVASG